MDKPILQVALDLLELKRAIEIAGEALEGGADWIEVGTPLIKSEGMNAVREIKRKFGVTTVADMKTIDTGAIEVEMAAKSGADIIIILALSDNSTIKEAIRAARKYGAKIMADLINTPNPVERAKELEKLGVDYINVHVGIDQQMMGMDPLEVLSKIVKKVEIPVATAGGLDAEKAAECVALGANIVIVGSNIIKIKETLRESARKVREKIDEAWKKGKTVTIRKKNLEEEIREILMKVSTPNISDAMHRAKAMRDIRPIVRGKKIVGKAVTVSTMDGDWAKPVEAIDVAGKGDVIVIKCSGDEAAVWGELATRSCINKGIAGVVIDGAVRDVDDIRELGYPVFAKREVPNAGEPKGFGEINVKIFCGGVEVNPGDWIVADDNGVMVIPKERAYEIARRALEVKKHEERIRGEIEDKGRTLAEIVELYKWEKVQ
uniref:Bifunctional hexulose-6-phosphate synthase/ribonuclease regulator n=1 Tax=Geoglobus ahangari TaxID=113653 RepID=A0A7C4W3G0_9EURY